MFVPALACCVPLLDVQPEYLPLVAGTPQSNGFFLAWVIMAGMLASLVYVVVIFYRAFQEKPLPHFPTWLDLTTPVLALIGMGVAAYLTYVETQSVNAICGPVGDCNAVQSSPYAILFGILPVGLLGLAGFLAILIAWFWRRLRSDVIAEYASVAIFGMALFGTLFSIYLTYLELFVIKAVCIWCLSSAVIITLLMLLGTDAAARWIAGVEEE